MEERICFSSHFRQYTAMPRAQNQTGYLPQLKSGILFQTIGVAVCLIVEKEISTKVNISSCQSKKLLMALSYQISLKLSGKFCFVHNMGISTSMAGDAAVVKVCCADFRDEVEAELKKHFPAELADRRIRLQLPAMAAGSSTPYVQTDE